MNILLGICGSISAYKSYELLRAYLKDGITVKVVLTRGALEFVNPTVLKSLGAEDVYLHSDDFNLSKIKDGNVIHIDLVKWCDRIVIAPASANTIAKVASGICDDLLTSIILANNNDKFVLIYPAMNTQMLNNKITQSNFQRLEAKNTFIHRTDIGELACKDQGAGKLVPVEMIKESSLYINLRASNKKVLINTGATISPLDPVRYLTNPASGKTGIALAKEFLDKGYRVDLVCGHNMQVENLTTIPALSIYHSSTTEQMYDHCLSLFDSCDAFISSAAISDIKFKLVDQKLKKSQMNKSLDFTQSIDILKSLSQKKKSQFIVGFAAETQMDSEKLHLKKESKSMDLLIANIVSNGVSTTAKGFGTNSNSYQVISNKTTENYNEISKQDLAKIIFKEVDSHA